MSRDSEANPVFDIEYVNMPQNDLQQIQQIAREYESEPARGLSHGLQKDAIQNGVGARIPGNREPNSYRDWKFYFRLHKINGVYALSFWDEGTTGLTGDILSDKQIEEWSLSGRLKPEQNLSRFLTRFDSGGNWGPGSFGRGKLIFQAASKTSTIICDSLRYNDNKYIAFDRKIEGTRLRQPRIPLQGEEAKNFIGHKTGLNPLSAPGTRITILDLKDEIVSFFKKSFSTERTDEENFQKMIEETWWEIITKFNAKIILEMDEQTKTVELTDPMKSIIEAEDSENGWRVYDQTNLPIVVDGVTYRIKELRIILSPQPIHEDLRGIWIQRKRMKIGYIKNLTPHPTIFKKIVGYLILDPELENIVLQSEGNTHYAYDWKGKGLRNIKQIVLTHLQHFEQQLGLRSISDAQRNQQDLLDAMRDINSKARELGLISDYSSGAQNKDIEISIDSFQLPNENSKRIEQDQEIGPIVFKIKNLKSIGQKVDFFLVSKQKESEEKTIMSELVNLLAGEKKHIRINTFFFDAEDYRYNEPVAIIAKVVNRDTGSELARISRTVWLGMDEPENPKEPFLVTVYQPLFPNLNSRRVELTETISNIRFKLTNNTASDVKINVDLQARKAQSQSSNVIVLKELLTERNTVLRAMSEREFNFESLVISRETFGLINEAPANASERKCEIYFSTRIAENNESLNMIQGQNIGKKKIEFYVGIDPPGHSIFSRVFDSNDPTDGKRSKHSGDRTSGYEFQLNVGHPSFKFAAELGEEAKREYIKEQMLHQAYAIAIYEKAYSGISEDYKEQLEGDMTAAEAYILIDEIVGKALIKMEA